MKPFVFISRNRYYLNDRSRSSHINETETIQIIEKNSTQIIDHEIVQTIDQTTTIVTVNHVLTPEIEIITTQIEKEIILSHHTEITNNIQFHKKNYRSSTPKHQRQIVVHHVLTPEIEHVVHHVLTPEIEIITTQIEKEIILSHHTEITNNIQFHKKNYRSSTPKHQRQMNQVQATEKTQSDPPAIDNTKNFSENRYSRSNSQNNQYRNNYSRLNSNRSYH